MILCRSGFFVRLFSVCMSLVMDSWLSWRNELRGSRVNINGVTFPFFRGKISWSPSERKQWPIKQVLSTISVEEDWLNGYPDWLYTIDVSMKSFFLRFSQPGSGTVDPTFTDNRSIYSLEATPGTGVPSNSLFWQLSTLSLPKRMDRLHLTPTRSQKFWPRSLILANRNLNAASWNVRDLTRSSFAFTISSVWKNGGTLTLVCSGEVLMLIDSYSQLAVST